MKLTIALILALTTSTAQAGGPVVIEEPNVVDQTRDTAARGQAWIIPLLILIGIAALASGGGDDAEPPKGCKTAEGC